MHDEPRKNTLSPPLSRKREREHTELAAPLATIARKEIH
jgi:hypothetical protein